MRFFRLVNLIQIEKHDLEFLWSVVKDTRFYALDLYFILGVLNNKFVLSCYSDSGEYYHCIVKLLRLSLFIFHCKIITKNIFIFS